MCTVSMVSDDWQKRHPQWVPQPNYPGGGTAPNNPFTMPYVPMPTQEPFDLSKLLQKPVTREEFDELKKELEEVKKLLIAAKKYDEATNQKDCEQAEKVALFKRLGELVGVSMEEVFKV